MIYSLKRSQDYHQEEKLNSQFNYFQDQCQCQIFVPNKYARDGTDKITTERNARQRVYQTQCTTLGSMCIIHDEEGWHIEVVYILQASQ